MSEAAVALVKERDAVESANELYRETRKLIKEGMTTREALDKTKLSTGAYYRRYRAYVKLAESGRKAQAEKAKKAKKKKAPQAKRKYTRRAKPAPLKMFKTLEPQAALPVPVVATVPNSGMLMCFVGDPASVADLVSRIRSF